MNKGGGHVSCGQSTVKSSDVYVREGAALAGDVPNAAEAGAGGRREVSFELARERERERGMQNVRVSLGTLPGVLGLSDWRGHGERGGPRENRGGEGWMDELELARSKGGDERKSEPISDKRTRSRLLHRVEQEHAR